MTPTETAAILRRYNSWRRGNLDRQPMPDPREIGEAIEVAVEMIERLEAAEKERNTLRAKIEQMERQKPVASIYIDGKGDREFDDWKCDLPTGRSLLYALPGAQGEEK